MSAKDPVIEKLSLTAAQRADLLAFLGSLTDDDLIHDPSLSNPF